MELKFKTGKKLFSAYRLTSQDTLGSHLQKFIPAEKENYQATSCRLKWKDMDAPLIIPNLGIAASLVLTLVFPYGVRSHYYHVYLMSASSHVYMLDLSQLENVEVLHDNLSIFILAKILW